MEMCEKCSTCKNKCKYYFGVKIQSFYCPKYKEDKRKK